MDKESDDYSLRYRQREWRPDLSQHKVCALIVCGQFLPTPRICCSEKLRFLAKLVFASPWLHRNKSEDPDRNCRICQMKVSFCQNLVTRKNLLVGISIILPPLSMAFNPQSRRAHKRSTTFFASSSDEFEHQPGHCGHQPRVLGYVVSQVRLA